MAIDKLLIERIDLILSRRQVVCRCINMMGGLCYMVDDKMCFGSIQGGLMVRVDAADIPNLLRKDGTAQMHNGQRPMKNFLLIAPEAYDMDQDLEFWIDTCLEFNPKATRARKR